MILPFLPCRVDKTKACTLTGPVFPISTKVFNWKRNRMSEEGQAINGDSEAVPKLQGRPRSDPLQCPHHRLQSRTKAGKKLVNKDLIIMRCRKIKSENRKTLKSQPTEVVELAAEILRKNKERAKTQ